MPLVGAYSADAVAKCFSWEWASINGGAKVVGRRPCKIAVCDLRGRALARLAVSQEGVCEQLDSPHQLIVLKWIGTNE